MTKLARLAILIFLLVPAAAGSGNTHSITAGDLAGGGWSETLASLVNLPAGFSHLVFWPATADKRGGNYRPEFDVLPPAVENSWDLLRQFAADRQLQLGWFSRPSGIAYRKTWDADAIVPFNASDPAHVAMCDARFDRMQALGCTAYYLDTYGASGDASYLKHLRDRYGRRLLLITEGGFDVQHVYAAQWPNAQDGKRPLGEYARWLMPGTFEVCRCFSLDGAKRAWAEGGVPIVSTSLVNADLMAAQAQVVNADGSSKVRSDVPLD